MFVFYLLPKLKSFFIRAVLLLYYFLFEFLFSLKEFFKSSVFVHFLSLKLLLFIVQFSRIFYTRSRRVPCYYITYFFICQGVFLSFFKFFEKYFSYIFNYMYFLCRGHFFIDFRAFLWYDIINKYEIRKVFLCIHLTDFITA